MKKNPSRLICLLFILGSVFIQACQSVRAVEYVKYENDAAVPRISVEDAKKEFEAGTAVIIDTRPFAQYKLEHITGSMSLPMGSPDEQLKALPTGKKLILYCSCPTEHTSAAMGLQMNQKGIPGTYAMVGGTNAWKTAGYPIEHDDGHAQLTQNDPATQ